MVMLVLIALALSTVAPAVAQESERPKIIEERRGNIVQRRVEGNLAPTQRLPCIPVKDARPTYTAADLYTGVSACLADQEYDVGARLFALASAYSVFDAERIADRSAGAGAQMLMMTTVGAVSEDARQRFSASAQKLASEPAQMAALCADIRAVGPPNYFPKYMILHGMNALTNPQPLKDALVPGFDADATWRKVQTTYLHCPGPGP